MILSLSNERSYFNPIGPENSGRKPRKRTEESGTGIVLTEMG